MAGAIVNLSETTFDEEVGASSEPVLVDFWAEWCGPCKMMTQPLEDIAGDNADTFAVAKLNVDENQQTAMTYSVMSIPTLIIFADGEEKRRLVGARSKAQLEREIAEFL